MEPTPRRPLLLNALWTAALVVSLASAYVLSFGMCTWMAGNDTISYDTGMYLLATVYAPIEWYTGNDLPGTRTLLTFHMYCLCNGDYTWEEADAKSGYQPNP